MPAQRRHIEATIDADGEFATLSPCPPDTLVDVSLSGTFTGTVSLQRRLDTTNWRTIQTWTAPVEATYRGGAGCELRLGFDTSGFGSGSAVVRLAHG